MMELIEIEINKLDNKTNAAKFLAKELKKKPSSILNHWFGSLSIPEKEQKKVYKLLKKYNGGNS